MPKGTPLTQEELERRRGEICRAAVQLFVEKGFSETSMRQIAEAAGIGKSTIYDYFPSKDEILIAYVAQEVHRGAGAAEEIMSLDVSVTEKIRRIMRHQLESMLANKHMNLKISFEIQRLSPENLQRVQAHRYAYQDRLCDLVKEGIEKGEFRPVNPLLAMRGMFSFLTTTVYTSRPTGSPEDMLEEVLDIFLKGLLA